MSYTPPVGAATTSSRGIIKLAGDLSGTADLPTVAKVNGVSVSGPPTSGQVVTATSGTTANWATPTTAPVATTLATGTITLAGDLAGTGATPTVAKVNGVAISGTPSSGQVPVASSGTAAAWGAVNDATAVKLIGSTMTGKLVVPTFQVTGGTLAAGRVLTSDASGNATWQTVSASGPNVVSKSTTYSASSGDYVIADATAAFTITLPTAVAAGGGATISVKKVDASANAVTIVASGGGAIDNVVSDAISTQWQSHDYLSNGTQWYLI